MARHRRNYKSYLNNRNPPKHYPNSMKSFDEFGVENRKIVLIEEYPCQNRKQPEKKEGEYIENDKNCLANVLLVGLERKIAMPQESITSNKKYKKKTNSITITIKGKFMKKRNAAQLRTHVVTKIKGIEKGTGKQ